MTAESIARLRVLFENELLANGSLYNPIDIERVQTNDWQVKRFILDQDGDEAKAFRALCRALQWKQSFGIHERTDQYFPAEYWTLWEIYIGGEDNEGHLILWEAIRQQRVFKETALLSKQFSAHVLEKVDQLAGEKGFIVVTDSNGGGLASMDTGLNKFKIEIMEYYPDGSRGIYLVDQPWVLNAVIKMLVGFMSERLKKRLNYIRATELPEVIDPKYIPVTLNGNRAQNVYPSNLIPMERRAAELGLDEKFVNNYYNTHQVKRPSAK